MDNNKKEMNFTIEVPIGDIDSQTFLDHFTEAHREAIKALSLATGMSVQEICNVLSAVNFQLDFDTEEATRISAELYDRLKALEPAVLSEKDKQRQRCKDDVDRKRRLQRGANPNHLGRQR